MGLSHAVQGLTKGADIIPIRGILCADIPALLIAFCFKSLNHSIFTRNLFGNIPLLLCVLLSFGLLLCGHYVPGVRDWLELRPVGAQTWIKMCISAVIMIALNEMTKLIVMKRGKE